MTCNKIECPTCRPQILARIRKKVRYYSQKEDLFFFNTITSKNGFEDLDRIWARIRNQISDNSIERYMIKKSVSKEQAEKWYKKKKEKMIQYDIDIEIRKILRVEAIIEVAKNKKVYYQELDKDSKKRFREKYKLAIENKFAKFYEQKKENLREQVRENVSQRFHVAEFDQLKFIRVIEFHENGQPHYHILTNKYISHYIMSKCVREGISEVYDNTYIVEDAHKKNPYLEKVDTEIVANYVSKITKYISKDTIESLELLGDIGVNKSIFSASKGIHIMTDEDHESQYVFHKVYDYQLKTNQIVIPSHELYSVERFAFSNSIKQKETDSIELLNSIDREKEQAVIYQEIIEKRIEQISKSKTKPIQFTYDNLDDLSEEQYNFITEFYNHNVNLLVGRAGSGKSYTLDKLLQNIKPYTIKILILTYTAKAAARLNEYLEKSGLIEMYKATTIHKALSSDFNQNFMRNEQNILDVELLIIDEVSMLSQEIISKILLAVPSKCRLLFSGDDRQIKSQDGYTVIPNLKSNEYVNFTMLSKVFRSNDFVLEQAQKVLEFKMIDYKTFDYDLSFLDNYLSDCYQILTNTKKMTKRINEYVQKDKKEITQCYGDFKYNVGDSVIITRNNTGKQTSNGDFAMIISFDDNGLLLELQDGRKVFYHYEDTEEIAPSTCITIHKSQGSEYDKVLIVLEDIKQLNNNNMIYTAVTRAKSYFEIYVPDKQTLYKAIVTK